MEKKHENFHEVIQRVLAHFKKHPQTWAGEELIEGRVQRLEGLDAALEAAAQGQKDSGSGAFSAKDLLLEEAATRTELMATRLRSLARHAGDPLLAAEADMAPSLFRHGAQADRIRNMRKIAGLAETHLAAGARFKLRAEDIAALRADLERAEGFRDSGRDGQTDRTSATARIPDLLTDARAELEALDDDVPALLDEHDDFVDSYFVARRVHDRRGSRSTPPAAGA